LTTDQKVSGLNPDGVTKPSRNSGGLFRSKRYKKQP
jgi:hypothetical protein